MPIGYGRDFRAVRCALRDVFADVFGQDLVDQRLVPDAAATRFLPKLRQDLGVEPDGDQPTSLVSQRRPPDAAHRPQLRGRRFGDVAVVNLGCGTPRAPAGSRGAR